MQPIADILATLRAQHVRVWLDGEAIRFQGAPSPEAATALAELKTRKPEVIEALRRARQAALAPIPAEARPRRIPLTVNQRAWFDPSDPDYMPTELRRTPVGFRLVGPFQPQAMIEAFQRLIQRHEILRTRYGVEDGVAYQEVLSEVDPMLRRIDLMDHPPSEFRALMSRILKADFSIPPEHGAGRPIRSWIFRLRPNIRVLALIIDHIALDNRSMNIILRELFAHYRVLAEGETDTLPDVPLHYADYAIWAQDHQSTARLTHNERAWRARMGDVRPTNLRSPQAHVEPGETPRGHQPIKVGEALSERISAFARLNGFTTPMVLIAAVGALLSAWSGKHQVLAGYVVDGRPSRMRDSVGSFVRTAPLLLDLGGDPTVAQLLARARQAYLDANDPKQMVRVRSFPGLPQVELNVQKKAAQVLFEPQDQGEAEPRGDAPPTDVAPTAPRTKLEVQSWRWSGQLLDESGLDLHIYFIERPADLLGYVLYAADRLDGEEVRRFTTAAPQLLEAMISCPDGRLAQLMAGLTLPRGPLPPA